MEKLLYCFVQLFFVLLRTILLALLLVGLMMLIAIPFLISWLATCLVIWLITLCFGIKFSLLAATIVWMVLITVRALLKAAD